MVVVVDFFRVVGFHLFLDKVLLLPDLKWLLLCLVSLEAGFLGAWYVC